MNCVGLHVVGIFVEFEFINCSFFILRGFLILKMVESIEFLLHLFQSILLFCLLHNFRNLSMKIIRKQASLPPLALLVTQLNGPCSSMAFAQPTPHEPIYLIIGKTTGEAVFFPISRSEFVSKFESEIKCPISAIAEGM